MYNIGLDVCLLHFIWKCLSVLFNSFKPILNKTPFRGQINEQLEFLGSFHCLLMQINILDHLELNWADRSVFLVFLTLLKLKLIFGPIFAIYVILQHYGDFFMRNLKGRLG